MVKGFDTLMVMRLVGRIALNITLGGATERLGSAPVEMSIMVGSSSSSVKQKWRFHFLAFPAFKFKYFNCHLCVVGMVVRYKGSAFQLIIDNTV